LPSPVTRRAQVEKIFKPRIASNVEKVDRV